MTLTVILTLTLTLTRTLTLTLPLTLTRYLTYFCTQCLGPITTTIICNVSGFIANSNNLLLLVTLALHTLQTVAIIFAILPLVRSAKSAEVT